DRADDVRGVGRRRQRAERRQRRDDDEDGAAEPEALDQSRKTARMASSYGARRTPRSVMMAVMSAAGVTSKARCRTATPTGGTRVPPICVTSAALRSSIGMAASLGQWMSIVDTGAAT